MANDTSINRSSQTDSVVPAARKKQNTQTLDFSQQSFLEELLTIGQFEATIPVATVLPEAKSASNDGNADSESDKEAVGESNQEPTQKEEGSNSAEVQAAVVAQAIVPQVQQPTPQANKEGASEDKSEKTPVKVNKNNEQNGERHTDANKSAPTPTASEGDLKLTDTSDKNSVAPVALDNAGVSTVDDTKTDTAPQRGDLETKTPTNNNQLKEVVQKSRKSSDSSEENKNQGKSEDDNPGLASNQNEITSDSGIALNKFDSENQSIQDLNNKDSAIHDGIESLTNQPRNKRAERLAERAYDGGASQTERETTVDPTLAQQQTKEAVPIEAASTAVTPTASSISTSSGVSATTPPVIAQPIAINGSGATTISSSKSNVESVVGVTTSRTGVGTQTGGTNTTISGNATNTGNTDRARSEVARTNSGTQITPYQEGKLVQRVLRGIEQLANGGGQVRLRLHPPELGALQMSLRMEGGQVFAKLEVENTTARDALLNNVQTLKDRMADQGMNVAAFEVEVSTDSAGSGLGSSSSQADGGASNQSRWENTSSRFAQQNSNRLPTEPTPSEGKPTAGWTRTNGSLDLTV